MTSLLPDVLRGQVEPSVVHLPPDVHSRDAATEAIELMAMLGRPLDEAQQFTLTAALGTRVDGSWAAFEVGDVQPRQNGKGNTLEAREVAGLFLFGERLQIHTAHEFPTANEAFLRMVSLIEANPWLSNQVQRIRFANGEQGVELKSGARLKYRARTGGAGRGFAGADLVVWDEAYALTAEHAAAAMPTLSTAPNPQLWIASSAGLAGSTLLWGLRKRALRGDAGRLAYCEHTAEDVTVDEVTGRVVSRPIDVADRRLWAVANPALGKRITLEYVESEFAAMPSEQFARERLGVFDPLPDEQGDPKLPREEWAASARLAKRKAKAIGPVVLAFDVDLDGVSASIGFAAGVVTDPYVEVLDHGRDVGWLARRVVERYLELTEKRGKPLAIAYNNAGPAEAAVGAVTVALRDAGISLDVLSPLTAGGYRAACGEFLAAVTERRLLRCHELEQGPLDLAAGDATERPLAEGWVWHRRQATVPISPLVAVTVAAHLLPVEAEPVVEFKVF